MDARAMRSGPRHLSYVFGLAVESLQLLTALLSNLRLLILLCKPAFAFCSRFRCRNGPDRMQRASGDGTAHHLLTPIPRCQFVVDAFPTLGVDRLS